MLQFFFLYHINNVSIYLMDSLGAFFWAAMTQFSICSLIVQLPPSLLMNWLRSESSASKRFRLRLIDIALVTSGSAQSEGLEEGGTSQCSSGPIHPGAACSNPAIGVYYRIPGNIRQG